MDDILKHYQKYIGIALLVAFFCMLAGLATLLVIEYRFFHRQAKQLSLLKDEYSNYITVLKRLIADNQTRDTKDSDSEEKKKLNDLEESFVTVNRQRTYLRQAAVEYARLHGLEYAVEQLYEAEEWAQFARSAKRRTQRQRTIKRHRIPPMDPKIAQMLEGMPTDVQFIWPIERNQFWLSSPFGPRKNPNGTWGFHHGIDMASVRNTPVCAAENGVVIEAGFSHGYGNTIVIAHNKKFKTRYAHLAKILVKSGDKIHQGTIIGKVGDTGLIRKRGKDGSHLHFEVYVLGKRVNPLYFLR